MKQPYLACLLIGACSVAAAAEEPMQGAGMALFASTDSEGFSTRRAALEYLPAYRHGSSLTGVRYTTSRFRQAGWSHNASQLSAIHRAIDPRTANGWQLEGGLSRQGGHELVTLEGSYRAALAENRSLEIFINRDWVDTRTALDNGVHFTFAGAALEQGVGPHVTVVGIAGYQKFSDGNARRHARARLIVQPMLDVGLTLQARYRVYTSGSEDVAGAYFNPRRYDEMLLALGYRKRLHGWTASLTAGAGRQKVADAPRAPARLLEAGLESPVKGTQSLRLRAGVSRSASFGGPNYSYRYAQAEWIVGF